MTTTAKTRTVRDIKHVTERQWKKQNEDVASSHRHAEWWAELNRLGWGKRTVEPGETRDLDATATLTEKEYRELRAKIPSLER